MVTQIEKIPCKLCGAMILPTTAVRTGGVCRPCIPRLKARSLQLTGQRLSRFRDFWRRLEESGWLSELSESEKDELYYDTLLEFHHGRRNPWELLKSPAFIVDECIEDDGDYVKILQDLSKHSKGKFTPVNIEDSIDYDNSKATISFQMNDHLYELTVPLEDDHFRLEVLNLINQALADSGIPQRYFPVLKPSEPGISLVYISKAVRDRAVELRLLRNVGA